MVWYVILFVGGLFCFFVCFVTRSGYVALLYSDMYRAGSAEERMQ